MDFSSNVGCVSKANLIAAVQTRAPRVRFVESDGDRLMRVSFERNRVGQIQGKLAVIRGSEITPLRQVVATSCADAAEAMSLILAITLDPQSVDVSAQPADVGAGMPDTTSAPPADTTVPAEPVPNDVPAPTTASAPTIDVDPLRPAPTVYIAPIEEESIPTPGVEEPWSFGAALGGELLFGPAPSVMRGVRIQLLLAAERKEVWSPAFLIGGVAVWSPLVEESEGDAEFAVQLLTLDVCPLRFGGPTLELRTCGAALGGRLSATGSNTRNSAGTVSRPFLSFGGVTSLHVRPNEDFELSARISALANVVRDEFTFTPRVFHSVAPFTFSLGVLAGFRLPY